MPVEDLEGKPFTCHICKECIYAPLYYNVYVTGILWFVDCKQSSYPVSESWDFEELADSVVLTNTVLQCV